VRFVHGHRGVDDPRRISAPNNPPANTSIRNMIIAGPLPDRR